MFVVQGEAHTATRKAYDIIHAVTGDRYTVRHVKGKARKVLVGMVRGLAMILVRSHLLRSGSGMLVNFALSGQKLGL